MCSKLMARLLQSFDDAFNSIHAELVEQLHVSTSLLNRLLDSNLLNQHHVDELKVYSLSLYSSNFDIDVRQSNHSVEIGWWLVCFHCTMLLPRAVDLCYGNCVCLFVSLSNYALCQNSYKFRSSYNKCIKKLFGFRRRDSMSGILIECLPTADAVHNARFLFDQLCTASCNNIVNIVMCLVAIGLKVKEMDLYSAFIVVTHTQGAQVRITQCYLQITPYLSLPRKHLPDGASPDWGCGYLIAAYYSFIYPERMKGWVGLVGRPTADGLPTLVVTRQPQVERRTAKVRLSETDVLPLCHATNYVIGLISCIIRF